MSDPKGGSAFARLCEQMRRSQDDQRQHLARALHDSASQTLAAAAMSLALVERERERLSPEATMALARVQELLAVTTGELRDLSHRLHPPLLVEVGLAPALRWLCRQLGESRVTLTVDPDMPRTAPKTELAVYRFVEEALTGAFASSGQVDGRVQREPGSGPHVRLAGEVQVRGEQQQPDHALVRLALRQRVRAAGGVLQIRPSNDRLVLDARFPA